MNWWAFYLAANQANVAQWLRRSHDIIRIWRLVVHSRLKINFFPSRSWWDNIDVEVFISIFHGILISLVLLWPILQLLFVKCLPGLLNISKSNQRNEKCDFLNLGSVTKFSPLNHMPAWKLSVLNYYPITDWLTICSFCPKRLKGNRTINATAAQIYEVSGAIAITAEWE